MLRLCICKIHFCRKEREGLCAAKQKDLQQCSATPPANTQAVSSREEAEGRKGPGKGGGGGASASDGSVGGGAASCRSGSGGLPRRSSSSVAAASSS
jgi:hypothetical protein